MRIFWMELRRSPLRWWFPALVALDVAVLFGRSQWWIGVWPQASAAAQVPAFYLGPFLAAYAAWASGRIYRLGFEDQHTAGTRPRWQVEGAHIAAVAVYGYVAYLMGAAVAAAVSYHDAGPGFLWPSYLLLGAALILLCIAVGHLAGRWFPSAFATPVVSGLACFLVVTMNGSPTKAGLFVLSGGPAMEVTPEHLAVRWALALSAVAVAVLTPRTLPGYTGERGKVIARLPAIGTSALAVACLAGVLTAGPVQTARANPSAPLCTHAEPKICVWPEERMYLPRLEAMARRISALPPVIKSPSAFYEEGLRGDKAQDVDFSIFEGSMWEVADSMSIAITRTSTPPYCEAVDSASEDRRTQAYFELDSWLAARISGAGQPSNIHGGPPGVDQAAIARLIKQPEAAQEIWAKKRITVIEGTRCA
ncbi:ABC transporter permease [Streptomyces acidiscabies]|uniref:ABC transporter permease n=1 Tax=Streptomyces acidiscabies TaxID=42234 RepID=A0AAP6BD00_9ACTN|nr:ABC transporter permease [Streptomyces acidiscabies]MBP5938360.1 ABC transporter permease [Streptomyces sp. LBUM 1476]MBZ3909454.1 ABC transporter permease [Streptomyces acidiscabies]MDX2962378.1 ABC transporter permease [Streptomyces acidiscabies]MDX3019830.1 ABC transporter permease [Streptomyces acidiscabies]MDX3792397.1 ABC transporter permease [Streptomyces acidiscabies]